MKSDALLIIDLQNSVCKYPKTYNFATVIDHVNQRIAEYHDSPVIFVQHCDEELVPNEELWQLVSELNQPENAHYILKEFASSFYQTDLKKLLTVLNVQTIEICGSQTEFCVDTTIKVAHSFGYQLNMFHRSTMTHDNDFLTAEELNAFYELIWSDRFVTFLD